jgi:hypothetical protein
VVREQAVVLGPPDSGKAHLLGRLLIDYGAFDRRVVERFMGPTVRWWSTTLVHPSSRATQLCACLATVGFVLKDGSSGATA